ncbi:hypothetical protein MLOOGBEN_21650 [Bacillus sp. EB106-08-02-XG196]|uniref:phospholipase D-like domain-containing protein n=1 Tax=Bacillus sp. EB106-08-02-XG196 TaxID=2737049 RepID=UPI0015C4B770|nr:phospholipase D-like domain-containing protein [Bacillus sp. EB106-08-02-XG196]NWQ43309.1 hypothetical protein [Bacillus sp. EB106-08-02-XG196]
MKELTINNGVLNLSKNEIGYQAVLDDFKHATHVNVVTYNISQNDSQLIDSLKKLNEDVTLNVVTNIPGRFETYYVPKRKVYKTPAQKALENIEHYCSVLNPVGFKCDVFTYFNFNNHAKIISTNNIAYIGSANFSDESRSNFEAGVIIHDKAIVARINNVLVEEVISDSIRYSTSYYNIVNEFMKENLQDAEILVKEFDDSLFTWMEVGYKGDIKIMDSFHGSISEEKWDTFQNLWYGIEELIFEVVKDFEDKVDMTPISQYLSLLSDKIQFLNQHLAEIVTFKLDVSRIAEEFDLYHTGEPEDREAAFELAEEKIREEREAMFEKIEDKAKEIETSLADIPQIIQKLTAELDLKKEALSEVIRYENQHKINNTGEKSENI